MMKTRLITLFSILFLLGGCGDLSKTEPDAGNYEDANFQPPDFWDPGDKPAGCADGGSDGCSGSSLRCANDPCLHGRCIESENGSDFCLCDEGYVGPICDACAPGYVASGLECILGEDPCEDGPCLYGTCRAQDDGFTCDCQQGYAGRLCDECAPGYHMEQLHCVPD